jgi:hypothetical protein
MMPPGVESQMQRQKRPIRHAVHTSTTLLIALLVALCHPARAETFHYDAQVAGIPVGSAAVSIDQDEDGYRIRGTASVRGAAYFVSDWHSDFHASGRMTDGFPHLETYGYEEQDDGKHRELTLTGGIVHITKNGRPRARFPAHGGLDVLTAFFIAPQCWPAQRLHTGRFDYVVRGMPADQPGSCRFEIEDNDGDTGAVVVTFERHAGRLVPAALHLLGPLPGRIMLRTSANVPKSVVADPRALAD